MNAARALLFVFVRFSCAENHREGCFHRSRRSSCCQQLKPAAACKAAARSPNVACAEEGVHLLVSAASLPLQGSAKLLSRVACLFHSLTPLRPVLLSRARSRRMSECDDFIANARAALQQFADRSRGRQGVSLFLPARTAFPASASTASELTVACLVAGASDADDARAAFGGKTSSLPDSSREQQPPGDPAKTLLTAGSESSVAPPLRHSLAAPQARRPV